MSFMLYQGRALNVQLSLAGWFTSPACTLKKAFWNVLNNHQQKLRARDQRAQDFSQRGWKTILPWILPSVSLAFHFNSEEEAGNLGLTCLKSTLNPPDILCFHLSCFWSSKRLKSVWTKLFFSIVDDTTIFRHKLSSNEERGTAKMSKPGSWRWLWYFH